MTTSKQIIDEAITAVVNDHANRVTISVSGLDAQSLDGLVIQRLAEEIVILRSAIDEFDRQLQEGPCL